MVGLSEYIFCNLSGIVVYTLFFCGIDSTKGEGKNRKRSFFITNLVDMGGVAFCGDLQG